jgi:hypothetical protein
VDVVWLNAMSQRQTDSSRVFSDSRHPKLPTPWPIWFCGQKSSGARFTEFRSDFYLFRQYCHSFSFCVTGKARKEGRLTLSNACREQKAWPSLSGQRVS